MGISKQLQPSKVWSKFSVVKETRSIDLCIGEAPLERLSEVAELVFNYFIIEEPSLKAAGILDNRDALEEYKGLFTELLNNKQMYALICYLNNEHGEINEIIGGSFMLLNGLDSQPSFKPKTKELQKWFEIRLDLSKVYNVATDQRVDQYYFGKGMVIHPNYRRLGIAQELYKIRRLVCKEHGVPLIVAVMSTYGSQIAAERDGWKTVLEIDFEDYERRFGVSFAGAVSTGKLMVARV